MKILAVDTSTASGSIALVDDSGTFGEWTIQSDMTHNRRLLRNVDFLLKETGFCLDQLDGFCVTTGPGSFTGIRIGLTTVKTLAWSLGKLYVGISSLDALAAPLSFATVPVCALINAHKNEVYSAMFRPDGCGNLNLQSPYRVGPPEQVIETIDEPTIFCGDGWLEYRRVFQEKLPRLAIGAPSPFHVIRASFVGQLGLHKLLAGDAQDPVASVPLYIRASEAEIHKQQSL